MSSLAEKIYAHCPVPLQNLMISMYAYKLNRREYGNDFYSLYEEFTNNQWLSETELEAYQDEKLALLIRHAYDNVPYYRSVMDENRLTPDDITSVDSLYKMPLLTRDDIKNNQDRLIARGLHKSKLIEGHTSGTTGSPLNFYYDRLVCTVKNVVDWRQKSWAGVEKGEKIAFLLGRMVVPIEQHKPPFWRSNWAHNHLLMSSFHMSKENIKHYINTLEDFKPSAVEGYPSTTSILARFLLSAGRTLPLKAVFTSSETLFPEQREAIERAFECRVFDFFGMAERVIFATECPRHEGHHINSDFGITEIIGSDGNPVAKGELGRIVATGLHNYAMPLIRYQSSDVTSLKDSWCSCGRKFPLMQDVTTKDEDIVTTKDGRLISSSILTHPFKPLHNIKESQVVQEDIDRIVVRIVKNPGYSQEDSNHLLKELHTRVGDDMSIELEFVDEIPRTKAGKFRFVVSKVPLRF